MATRPTKEFTLQDGSIFTLKTYLTVGEEDQIQGVFIENADMKQNGKNLEINGMKASVGRYARNKLLEIIVISIQPPLIENAQQGLITDSKQIIDYVLDMPKTLYKPLEKEINDITDPKES